MQTQGVSLLLFGMLSLVSCGPAELEEQGPSAAELKTARHAGALTESSNIQPGTRYTHVYYTLSGGNCIFQTTQGTLLDSVMWLHDSYRRASVIASDDDGGASRIQRYLPPGRYFITVGGYDWISSGTYEVSMSCRAAVSYQAHVSDLGWLIRDYDGFVAGTTGQRRQMEAIRLSLSGLPETSIRYTVHAANIGWMGEFYDGQIAGTTGQRRQLEAIRIWLENAPPGCGIAYEAHLADIGWQGVRSDGEIAGTTGQARRMEALRVWLTGDCTTAEVEPFSHEGGMEGAPLNAAEDAPVPSP
jgi:hypothetical protein